jgi:diacylglycerol kinase family enzyme
MDQIKLVGVFANDVSTENTEHKTPAINGAKEIRPLNEFELVIAAGGDGVVCW